MGTACAKAALFSLESAKKSATCIAYATMGMRRVRSLGTSPCSSESTFGRAETATSRNWRKVRSVPVPGVAAVSCSRARAFLVRPSASSSCLLRQVKHTSSTRQTRASRPKHGSPCSCRGSRNDCVLSRSSSVLIGAGPRLSATITLNASFDHVQHQKPCTIVFCDYSLRSRTVVMNDDRLRKREIV
jgi:hypothetical protein